MRALAVAASRPNPPPVLVTAYVRGRGLDFFPDTYCITSVHTDKIGVGDRLLMVVLNRHDNSVLSRYTVTLKAIRLRGADVTEFRGECVYPPLKLVYVQAATYHARVSKFALWDLLRGRLTLTDPLPPWRNFEVNVVRLPLPAMPLGYEDEDHPPKIEVRVSVESCVSED